VGKFLITGVNDPVVGEVLLGLNLCEGEGCTREAYLGHRDAGCGHPECNSCQPSRAANSVEHVWAPPRVPGPEIRAEYEGARKKQRDSKGKRSRKGEVICRSLE
jgi:hypothetical protein